MNIFRVQHKKSAAACYYLRAESASEAIERVTLILEDPGGAAVWSAEPSDPDFDVAKGDLLDRSGKRIKTLEA